MLMLLTYGLVGAFAAISIFGHILIVQALFAVPARRPASRAKAEKSGHMHLATAR